MKQIAFRLNKETERVEAYLVEHRGLQEEGSVITVETTVLDEALKRGIAVSKRFGRGTDNVFYEFESLTIAHIKDGRAILLDRCINENEPIGLTFAKARKSISLNKTGGKNSDRVIPRVSMKKVRHDDKKHEEVVITEKHPVSLAGVLWNIKLNNISGLELKDDEVLDIVDMDVHHIREAWDNRLENTILLTKEEHKQYHQVNGKERHHVYVKITSVEELVAFIEYVTEDR